MVVSLAPSRCNSARIAFPSFRFQSFNRISHHGHAPAAFQQPLYGEANAVFRDHPKHHKLSLSSEPVHQSVRVPALKNIQRLLFQQTSADTATNLPAVSRPHHSARAQLFPSPLPESIPLLPFPSRNAVETF